MKKETILLLNGISRMENQLLINIDIYSKKIKDSFNEIFEINLKAFELYTDIKIGDKVSYLLKEKRKPEVLNVGYFNGFTRNNASRAYYFTLVDENNKELFNGMILMNLNEMDRFSKII